LSGYEFQPSQSGKTLQTIKTNINNEKNILLLSIGLLLISCSSEENKIRKNQISSLIKLEQRQFENGVLTEKIF
jgi:hypothetical protein